MPTSHEKILIGHSVLPAVINDMKRKIWNRSRSMIFSHIPHYSGQNERKRDQCVYVTYHCEIFLLFLFQQSTTTYRNKEKIVVGHKII